MTSYLLKMMDERRDAYMAVAAEMPELTLDDLDETIVAQAKAYADEHDLAWPPAPHNDGWTVTITSWR